MPRQRTATHGSASMYRYGCRCEECTGWKSRVDSEYTARRRAEFRGEPVENASKPVAPRHIDAATGEVALTPQQQKKAELEAMLLNLGKQPKPAQGIPPRPQTPQRPPNTRRDDGTVGVPAGWE